MSFKPVALPSLPILVMALFLHFMGLGLTPLGAAMVLAQNGDNPIPRYIAIGTNKAHMRTGPSQDYPIKWVYQRPDYPLRVVGEDGPWRQVEDPEGFTGWIHRINLVGGSRRTALIKGPAGTRTYKLYGEADATSSVVLTAESGVTGRLMTCIPLWCELRINGTRAWIERRHLWGIFPGKDY